jgi:hypothetical protein
MSSASKAYFERVGYLGEFMPMRKPSLSLTCCMDFKRRKQLATLKYISDLLKKIDKKQFETEIYVIDKIAIPLIKELGFAEWKRDPVTDMAIAKGKPKEDRQPQQIEENIDVPSIP